MRTALRTAVATVALLGAVALPASAAVAAGSHAVATASARAATPAPASGDARYDGYKLYVAPGTLAVLRNVPSDGGPEVWLRAVSAKWQQTDGWAGRVLAKLDRGHTTAVLGGRTYRLTGAGTARPMLEIATKGGVDKHRLPEKGEVGTLVRTVKAVDGSYLKIYRITAHDYRGEDVHRQDSLGTLHAKGATAGGQHNGVYFALTPAGQGYSWSGSVNAQKKTGTYRLPNGVLAKLSKRSGVWAVQLVRAGHPGPVRSVPAGSAATAAQDGDTIVVLNGDGTFSNHLVGAAKQAPAVYLGA
ncbi:hypothetical protein AB0E88_12905 [Streptomyces sp. NPDC028635]|uniref:hypothetical protein n=1 Tax=Streptomyces sp. NPDC028635 TaxID=3154800 RepID=UPI0033E1B342